MVYNLYRYFFQDAVNQVQKFRIDLSYDTVLRFELDEVMMPVRSAIFRADVKDLKEALRQITRYLIPDTDTEPMVEELLLHLKPGDSLTLFGDTMKYDDQKTVTDFLLQMGHGMLVTVPGQHYRVKDFVHS